MWGTRMEFNGHLGRCSRHPASLQSSHCAGARRAYTSNAAAKNASKSFQISLLDYSHVYTRPYSSSPFVGMVGRRSSVQIVHASSTTTKQPPAGLSIMEWTGDDVQVSALNALRESMRQTSFGDAVTEEQLKWFLLDRKLDVEAATEKLVKMLEWRKEFGADSITTTDVAQEAATGKAYLHTHRDVLDRPVIVVRAAKHVKDAAPLVESQKLCVFTLERALERLPEGQDTVLGIFDLRGFQSQNADMGFVKFMIDIFFTYYPKRLSQVLFVDAPWIFKPGWEMMKPWLKKYAALVRFVSADEVRKEYFTQESLPDDFRPAPFLSSKK